VDPKAERDSEVPVVERSIQPVFPVPDFLDQSDELGESVRT
jgi:hypothetical protein